MAKAAKSSRSGNAPALFLPGAEVWELWRRGESGGFDLAETTELVSAAPGEVPPGVHFAYPVLSAFAVPFWASSDDPSILEDLGDLQLEKLGLKPANLVGNLREFRVVDTVGNRSLVVATVLAPKEETGFSRQSPVGFEVTPFLYQLPNDSVTIWRELGHLVLAVTRNEVPIYFHAMAAAEIDAGAIQEIRCVLLQLTTQGVIDAVDQVVLWLGLERDPGVEPLVRGELGLPVRFGESPRPSLPAEAGALVPEEVAQRRLQRKKGRRLRSRLLLGALLYLLVIGAFVGRLLLVEREAEELRALIARDQPQADDIRETMLRWESLRPAIDADTYPMELLLKCVEVLPPRGVRLTQFQLTNNEIFLKGEASSAPEAIKFKGVLTKDPMLSDYEWNFPQPVIVPNKGATFQTKGTLKYAAAQEE
ncbi:MAG: hypothetical protein ACC661_08600 [Verrucomicrobiales bacterium]